MKSRDVVLDLKTEGAEGEPILEAEQQQRDPESEERMNLANLVASEKKLGEI